MAEKRVLIAGGAGFIGSHLVEKFIQSGYLVDVVDNLSTGDLKNLNHLKNKPFLRFFHKSVEEFVVPSETRYSHILHFASPASPVDFQPLAIEILNCHSFGTWKLLEIAKEHHSVFLFASSSEVYGDPIEHPQSENTVGCVNTLGPRAPYDEGKRFSETLCLTFFKKYGVDVRITRIFNTFGPRMRQNDGRVIPNFIVALLKNEPLPVHGDGTQTRSFCYISDLVEGIFRFSTLPSLRGEILNLGNIEEVTILQLANLIQEITGKRVGIKHLPRPEGDANSRKPDISKAIRLLKWTPIITLREGLTRTWEWAVKNYSF